MMTLTCEWCGANFDRPSSMGPTPKYCSDAHRQAAHRARHTPVVGPRFERFEKNAIVLRMPVEDILLAQSFRRSIAEMWEQAEEAMAQRLIDRDRLMAMGITPMDYKPGRAELREVQRPERVRSNIRRNLAQAMPRHRRGRFVPSQRSVESQP